MPRRWRSPAAVAGALFAVAIMDALIPSAAAQDDGIEFPPMTSGVPWEGYLDFSGFISIDYAAPDGSFTTTVTDVIDSTVITLGFTIGDGGQAEGTMTVDLTWFSEAAGAASNGDPFHVVHDHHQTGTLRLSGTAARLVANGTLVHETNTFASGSRVEEVSGSEERDVEWVFEATEAQCARVTAGLVEASGRSLVGSALVPRDVRNDDTTYHNELVAQILAWPRTANPEAVEAAVERVRTRYDELRAPDHPAAAQLWALIYAWSELSAELAALSECQAVNMDWQPEFSGSWLDEIIRDILATALEDPDHYEASDLIDMWDAMMHEGVRDTDLILAIVDELHAKVDAAIAASDRETIIDIYHFAAANGRPLLYEKASAALGLAP